MATTGTYGAASVGGRTLSAGTVHGGFQFSAPGTGTVSQIKVDTAASTGSGNWVARVYSDNAGNPGTQIGIDSNTLTVTSSGAQIFVFGTPPSITNAVLYWIVLINPAAVDWSIDTCANDASYGSGRDNTVTSITATGLPSSEDWRMEITYALAASDTLMPAILMAEFFRR